MLLAVCCSGMQAKKSLLEIEKKEWLVDVGDCLFVRSRECLVNFAAQICCQIIHFEVEKFK